MSIWKKTVLIVSLTFLILTIILYFIAQNIMLGSFIELEKQMAMDNIKRVRNALHDNIEALSAFTADWASWDDSYEYINDLNKEYRETNLVDTSFTVLKINFLIFVNTDGQIVFKEGFDLQEEAAMPVPQSFLSHIKSDSVLLRHEREEFLDGLLYLPEGPMIISAHPLLTSEDRGPSRGTLIMARFLDSAVLDRLAERTRLPLTVHPFESNEIPDGFLDAKRHLTGEARIYINTRSKKTLVGYALLEDIFDRPALLLGSEMERDIYLQGRNSVTYFILSVVIVIFVSGVLMLFYLNWLYRTYKN